MYDAGGVPIDGPIVDGRIRLSGIHARNIVCPEKAVLRGSVNPNRPIGGYCKGAGTD